LGARPVDYRSPHPISVDAFNRQWTLDAFPRQMRIQIVPDTARPIVLDKDGLLVILTHQLEQGHVTYALPSIETTIASTAGDRTARDRWQEWYAGMLDGN
jgi:hypothetical protein